MFGHVFTQCGNTKNDLLAGDVQSTVRISVARFWLRFRSLFIGPLTLGLFSVSGLAERIAEAQYTSSNQNSSWTDSISSGFKQGMNKIGSMFSPSKPSPGTATTKEDDAISLNGKGKPDANLYVAVARRYEENNLLAEAEQQYQTALKEKPGYLPALLGYAQLEERLGKPEEAIRLYKLAAKTHPQEAAVYNNMGIFFSKQKQFNEAVEAMRRAVRLDPKNLRYRNNLASILVDQGQMRGAFEELRQIQGDAVAYYNLGYLLNSKGQTQEALLHFTWALQADPSLVPAQRWIAYLQQKTAQTRLPKPMDAGVKIISQPIILQEPAVVSQLPRQMSQELVQTPNDTLSPLRLPPTSTREPTAVMDGYGNSYNSNVSPLPPVIGSRSSSDSMSGIR